MNVGKLYASITRDGGYTYSPSAGRFAAKGKALSIFPQHEYVFDARRFTPYDIEYYVSQVEHELDDPRVHLGGWHDTESGRIYLDLSVVVPDHQQAAQLASEFHQLAYFDLDSLEEIRL